MSKNKIRIDKTCLNCNYVVESKFCPNCGQENVETRKSFYHLFIHFFEDLTHYENAFWRTIKNLILKPAALTKEYLSGKRMSYLAPVRLYIFISFATFFIFSVLPDQKELKSESKKNKFELADVGTVKTFTDKEKATVKNQKNISFKEKERILKLLKSGVISKTEADSLQKVVSFIKENNTDNDDFLELNQNYTSVKELDSIQKFGAQKDKMGPIAFWLTKKIQQVKDKNNGKNLQEKFLENFSHNIPKAIFLYMPIFAFLLWLFHNKKKWYYFDHGIFTLHYFSFLLLASLIIKLTVFGFDKLVDSTLLNVVKVIFESIAVSYTLYYFFPAHHRVYGGKRRTTILLGSFLFLLNSIFICFFLLIFAFYSLITIH